MRYLSLLSLIGLAFWLLACQSEEDKALSAYESARDAFSASPSAEQMTAYLNAFDAYRLKFPKQADIPKLTNEVAVALTTSKLPNEAIKRLKSAIRQYREAPYTANNVEYMGLLYQEELNQPEVALSVYQSLQQAYPNFERMGEVNKRIPDNIPAIETRLDTLRQRIYGNATTGISANVAERFVGSVEALYLLQPTAPAAPGLLAQAGEMARISGQAERSVDLYRQLTDNFPQHKNAPQALFFQGFILENDLGRLDDAKAAYEAFLRLYPDDDFADDTEFLLKNLGKDGVEIIEGFEE